MITAVRPSSVRLRTLPTVLPWRSESQRPTTLDAMGGAVAWFTSWLVAAWAITLPPTDRASEAARLKRRVFMIVILYVGARTGQMARGARWFVEGQYRESKVARCRHSGNASSMLGPSGSG